MATVCEELKPSQCEDIIAPYGHFAAVGWFDLRLREVMLEAWQKSETDVSVQRTDLFSGGKRIPSFAPETGVAQDALEMLKSRLLPEELSLLLRALDPKELGLYEGVGELLLSTIRMPSEPQPPTKKEYWHYTK